MNSSVKSETSTVSSLLSGLAYAFSALIILTVITSFVLWSTGLKESALSTLAYAVHCVALLIGGIVSGRRGSSRGWYHGTLLGSVYFLLVLLVGYLSFDGAINWNALIFLMLSLAAGAFGGILGVNTKK